MADSGSDTKVVSCRTRTAIVQATGRTDETARSAWLTGVTLGVIGRVKTTGTRRQALILVQVALRASKLAVGAIGRRAHTPRAQVITNETQMCACSTVCLTVGAGQHTTCAPHVLKVVKCTIHSTDCAAIQSRSSAL